MRQTSKLPMTLLPKSPGLRLEDTFIDADTVSLSLASTALPVTCPVCAQKTGRLHSHYGHTVAALTTSDEEEIHDYLKELGAAEIVGGPEWSEEPRPLDSQKWAGAVDAVGSTVLARVLSETAYGGAVACCGLAGGADLSTTVMPFILRGVSLRGVDSVACPFPRRKEAWERLAGDLPADVLKRITQGVISLEEVPQHAQDMVSGKSHGRAVVDPNV